MPSRTEAGKILRKTCLLILVLHTMAFIVILILLDQIIFMGNLLMMIFLFSAFLSLSDTAVCCYLMTLFTTMTCEIAFRKFKKIKFSQEMTLYCLFAMYILNFILLVKATRLFRKMGGLKGKIRTEENWEGDLIIFKKKE